MTQSVERPISMTDERRAALLALAEHCEAATEVEQRFLLDDAFTAIHGERPPRIHGGSDEMSAYLAIRNPFVGKMQAEAFVDAALTLVTEGWVLTSLGINQDRKSWSALMWVDDPWTDLRPNAPSAKAATPALAICAASLRVRASA